MLKTDAFRNGVLLALILVMPVLAGYAAYLQWQAPTMDFLLDEHNPTTVREVVPGGYAEKAGLEAGDVILTIDDVPAALWYQPETGKTHIFKIERRGEQRTLAIPTTRVFRLNYPFLLSAIIASLAFWAMGTLLFLRRFGHPATRLLFLLSQAVALMILFPLSYHAPWKPPLWALALSVAGFHLTAPLLLHYAISFPVRLGTPRQRRVVLGLAYAGALLTFGLWISGFSQGVLVSILFFSLVTALALAGMLYVYLYRASPDERRRTRVVVFGTLLATLPAMLFYLLPSAMRAQHRIPEWLIALFLLAAPASYLYATLRYNLFDIDRLLNRTLVYVLMALGVFVVYLTPYLFLYRYAADNLFAQLTFIFVLALWVGWTFDWMRQRTQRFVDKLFYGGWYDYPAVVETVSNALARSSTREEVTDVLTRQLPALMRLQHATLQIGADANSLPEQQTSSPTRFRFNFQSDIPARWTVGLHHDGDDLSEADRRILHTVAQQAEVALNNAFMIETLRRQLEEIRASREALAQMQHRLLISREEERSRLARDLHDGPIQSLIGLNIQLGLLLNTEPLNETVAAAFTDMRSEIRGLSSELRQVCTELRPPMLDTLGLGAAIRSLVETWAAQSGVEVRLSLPPAQTDFRTLPEEVALNFYRVAQETLTNIGKHAQATQVDFALAYENNRLTMTIQDNGRGFTAPLTMHELTAQKHFGLAGMKERMEQIGGQWQLTSAPGNGTTIQTIWTSQEAYHV